MMSSGYTGHRKEVPIHEVYSNRILFHISAVPFGLVRPGRAGLRLHLAQLFHQGAPHFGSHQLRLERWPAFCSQGSGGQDAQAIRARIDDVDLIEALSEKGWHVRLESDGAIVANPPAAVASGQGKDLG